MTAHLGSTDNRIEAGMSDTPGGHYTTKGQMEISLQSGERHAVTITCNPPFESDGQQLFIDVHSDVVAEIRVQTLGRSGVSDSSSSCAEVGCDFVIEIGSGGSKGR